MAILIPTVALSLGALSAKEQPTEHTDATWQSQQHAASPLTSGIIPAPALVSCRYLPGLLGLGARVELTWSLPQGYTLSEAQVHASTSGVGSVLAPLTGFSMTQNTVISSGNYVTTVPVNLLGGLLGLGSELELSVVVSRHGWTTQNPRIARANPGLVGGLGGSCRLI
ncbi:hypothetical protein [Nesterenkonia rhizosphaerae]|uniref:Uncharacterized protein n=1 Tax=Nesterenkonia rhizosphaerae TaxID=1348272 RepID=A0ABP9FX64_9MICC